MIKPTASIVLLLCATAVAGCVHLFSGAVAELDGEAGVEIVQRAHSYGDCYRLLDRVPVVYRIQRGAYELRIAHGQRYWPAFFLTAVNSSGTLDIVGNEIREVDYPRGGDMRRLQETRGIELTHAASLSQTPGRFQLVFQVRDRNHAILGTERLSYEVKAIRCAEGDGL